jgi:hypothetical protein
VERHPSFACVCSLEATTFRVAKCENQVKWAAASSELLLTTGTFKRRPMTSANILEGYAFFSDRVVVRSVSRLVHSKLVTTFSAIY